MNDETYITVNGKRFPTLIAFSYEEQQKGLMGQKWPPPVMSFLYKNSGIRKFWMKNTPSPLDIVFCNKNKIVSICFGEPYSQSLIGPDSDCDLVIEFPYSTCEKYKFKVGDSIHLNLSENTIKKFNIYKYYI